VSPRLHIRGVGDVNIYSTDRYAAPALQKRWVKLCIEVTSTFTLSSREYGSHTPSHFYRLLKHGHLRGDCISPGWRHGESPLVW